ncbi:hypothetical protein [Nocardioides sp. CFH 31398]|uniref:hypothetical protein n=1 Tax=Nocardioides sp. CFH 31398 TaxID=2919579 RepID=UPI001F06D38D|nr:hypothetical protein [Nocardioides sp. CFH 31398]MCH1865336.1 hypothetical protein [Nocardioides sp. CFH 31398]
MRTPALLLLGAVVGIGAAVPATSVAAPTTRSAGADAGCATPLFDAPVRAGDARREDPAGFRTALAREPGSAGTVAAAAGDRTLWLDRCGRAFYRDLAPDDLPGTPAAAAVGEDVDVLALHSSPGSDRTIYLDLDGHVATGTHWNAVWGIDEVDTAVYDFEGDLTTDFTEAERAEVFALWEAVAEDFAPFDVDVTTADPGPAALTRSSTSDREYGTRVAIGASPSGIGACGPCGGVAFLGVFDEVGEGIHDDLQPAWVFTDLLGGGRDGRIVAEAASHEVGHTLDLQHDGLDGLEYYSGHGRWAPIMGAGYGRTVTQWSRGDYPAASNTEDDLAVMARGGVAPRVDDHGGADDPTPLAKRGGSKVADGVVGTSADVDAFSFALRRAGTRRITVLPTGQASNLDVRLTVLDAAGKRVARVNPPVPAGDDTEKQPSPAWLAADTAGPLPAGRYTLLVEGMRAGGASRPGWSDYASLGGYRVSVAPLG